jgi:glycosyltransferase involved in cell wall biosynthesis
VHFLGRVPYAQYLLVLQIPSVHVYLTYPFVLSWSMLDAMAVGSVVIGSKTAPVQEVIEDGINGYLVDFFSHAELAEAVCRACLSQESLNPIREAARTTIAQRFDLRQSCLSQQLALLCPTYDAALATKIIA